MRGPVVIGANDLAQAAAAFALAERLHDPVHTDVVLLGTRSGGSGADDLCEIAATRGADLIVVAAATGVAERLAHTAPCALAVAPEDPAATSARVCVAYDGSPESDVALDAAYEVALRTTAGVLLCHVLEPPLSIAAMRAAGRAIALAVRRAPASVPVERLSLHGLPGPAILAAAGDDAGLVVAGSARSGPERRLFAGSVSGFLLAHARVPVLITARPAGSRRTVIAPGRAAAPTAGALA